MKGIFSILFILAVLLIGGAETGKSESAFSPDEATASTVKTETVVRDHALPLQPIPTEDNDSPTSRKEPPASSTEEETAASTEDAIEPEAPGAPSKYAEMEAEVLRLLNKHREEAGVEPLQLDYAYYICAETRAKECLTYWSHTRPDGRKSYTVYYDYDMVDGIKLMGENLARNFRSLEDIVDMLMDSPAHRKNILLPAYNRVTISIVAVEGYEKLYAMSQLFIKKD